MAKQQTPGKPNLPSTSGLPSVADLPSVGAMTEGDVPVVKDVPVQLFRDKPEGDSMGLTVGMIEVPMLNIEQDAGFVRRRIDVKFSAQQAANLKRIKMALDAKDARLAGGQRVTSLADAMRWLLENIA